MQRTLEALLTGTDIQINGARPWDIQVHHPLFYRRVLGGGSLALGESYMDGWWDCAALDELVYRIFTAGNTKVITYKDKLHAIMAMAVNWQKKARAFNIGEKHYDIGNDLYKIMLDKRMVYSCAYWNQAHSLDGAQEAKLNLICQKIYVEAGMTILDVGCGWGGFAQYAAEKYHVAVTGITVSREQAELARDICQGYPIEIVLKDYRDIAGTFDRIIAIGMFEHVGYKNYQHFFRIMHNALKDGGLLLIQTIGGNKSVRRGEPWIDKYIFPDGMIPSIAQIGAAAEQLFVMEDWHNLGNNYDTTLLAWHKNVTDNWPCLKGKYDDRFYRMWRYYLLSCAGLMRARHVQPWQIVFSKRGMPPIKVYAK